MLEKSKTCFKRTNVNNKYQSKASIERSNQYLDYLINPSFQRVNRLFVLSFEDNAHSKGYNQYFFPTIETKDYNVMIDDKTFFISQIKKIQKHMIVFKKNASGHGDDYATGCLLGFNYLKEY